MDIAFARLSDAPDESQRPWCFISSVVSLRPAAKTDLTVQTWSAKLLISEEVQEEAEAGNNFFPPKCLLGNCPGEFLQRGYFDNGLSPFTHLFDEAAHWTQEEDQGSVDDHVGAPIARNCTDQTSYWRF